MDLTMMGTVVPKMAANFISGGKFISQGGHATQVFFLLEVMAYDRDMAVCNTL